MNISNNAKSHNGKNMMKNFDKALVDAAKKVTKKRAKIVIDHILEYGHITTEELKNIYGYNHPPRAARDVREEGIPLITFNVISSDDRKIGAYTFGNPSDIEGHKLGGRKTFSKTFKKQLIELLGERSTLSGERYNERYLQIDHRIPYEVAGDDVSSEENLKKFMLLTATEQRQKSWSCECCNNFLNNKDKTVCNLCYWASPELYSHIAMEERRQVIITWKGNEINSFNELEYKSNRLNLSIPDYIKKIIWDKKD